MNRVRRPSAILLMTGLVITLAGASVAKADTPSVPPPSTGPTTSTGQPTTSTATPTRSTSTAGQGNQGGQGGGNQGGGSSSGSSGSATIVPTTLAITLQTLTPTVVTPTSTLTIRGTITNVGRTAIQNGTVRLLVHHSPLVTRSLVAEWGAGGISDVGGRILGASADLTVDLAAGASTPFVIRAPAPQLGLTMDYASIGITLEALGDDGSAIGTHRLGLLRTFITWQAKGDYTPIRMSWFVPLTGGPSSPTGGPADAATLAPSLATTARLGHVLSAIASAPAGSAVSVAIDPALVSDLTADASTPAGPGETPTGGATTGSADGSGGAGTTSATGSSGSSGSSEVPQQTVSDYLARLETALTGHRIVQLPYGDPDLTGVADTHDTDLLAAATAAAGVGNTSIIAKDLGVTPITDVAFPAGGWADAATISAADQLGAKTLVLAASSRPPLLNQDTTPSGLAPLNSSTDAVLYDDVLSSQLAHATSATTSVLTVQRFLAETLAIVGERPGRARIVLVAAPRSFNPDPSVTTRLFSAVSAAPWIRPASLTQLRAGQGEDAVIDRGSAPLPTAVRRAQIPTAQVDAVRTVRSEAADLAAVIDDDPSLSRARTEALRLVSASLRSHSGTAATKTKALRAQFTAIGAKVRILPLSNLNFLASDGNLTLSVANDLTHNVHGISVEVQPQNGRLVVVRQAHPITVDAQRRTTIKVHVHAVAGGVVPVTAQIVTPSGLKIGSKVTVQVHVRPTDTWAFWVIGVAAGLVLIVGLTRTIRRGRSRPRLQAPEVEPM